MQLVRGNTEILNEPTAQKFCPTEKCGRGMFGMLNRFLNCKTIDYHILYFIEVVSEMIYISYIFECARHFPLGFLSAHVTFSVCCR